ncbi:MAG: reprolysin-like metallopeptidase, partial [Chitinophagaceae bacterium]
MKKLVLFMLSFTLAFMAVAQERNYWTSNTDASRITTDKAVARQSFPKDFKLFNLDVDPLRQELFKVVGNSSRHSTIISLPNANGQIEQFEVYEASNFEPALQAQFPGIRAFSGKGITDKSATLKLSFSPQGIQTMVFRTEQENEFIEAYSQDHTVYAVFKSQRQSGQLPWRCSTPEEKLATDLNSQVAATGISARSGGNLKTMRLAQSCNAEYSNYFGATSSAQVALVLAAFNATLTRCNGVYEKDLALHLNLIANTTSVIYYNPSTDPYSTTLSQWNAQLQSTLTSVIGEANYDIGHMFGASGGGGNAGCIGCVCVNGSKGSGITSPNDGIPQGDNFDIDYVTHEVGHQLGANHTFSMSSEGTGVNKEVGSGITIMGYAGITSQDVAPHSIDIFHQASIAQIQSNLATKTCPVTTTITNATPVVSAGSNYTIPISTPFALTGSATDANAGDVLTYCWEQNDNSTTTGANSVASPTKATGPNWISFNPTTSPTRVFPKLATILAGANVSGPLPGGDAVANTEALSSVSRTLNFRLTVRDNAPYSSTSPISVGQTQFANMVVTVSNTSGPFAVTSPNSAVTWAGNSSQTVTWSVNNTTAAPVSCANVKISISTDGGNTFSTLVASTANDGSELVTIPNTPSTTARIKVEAVGNIFFDISNTNFTIGGAAACGNPTGLLSSSITNTSATVSWTAVSGALSYDVDYKATSSGTWINAATATTSTTVGLAGLVQGTTYDWRVRATCSGGSGSYVQAQFTTTAPCNTPAGLASSAITASSATVSWTAVSGANNYTVEYKTTAGSTWTTAASATTSTSQGLSGLSASTSYDWRVRANCASGSSAFAQAQFTTTIASTCPGTYDISTNGTASGAALIPKNTDIKGLISPSGDNDYYRFTIATGGTATITLTTLPADYDIRLYSSNGTTQLAISQNGST